MQKLPILSYDLVKELNEMYPPITPSDSISDRELWGTIYQRRLIDHLLFIAKVPPVDPLD
jgi:hypothetical protein